MRQNMLDTFRCRLHDHVCKSFPDTAKTYSDAELFEYINIGIARAQSFGLTTELHITRFIDYCCMYSFDFGSEEGLNWARPILIDPFMNADEKIQQLEAYELFAEA